MIIQTEFEDFTIQNYESIITSKLSSWPCIKARIHLVNVFCMYLVCHTWLDTMKYNTSIMNTVAYSLGGSSLEQNVNKSMRLMQGQTRETKQKNHNNQSIVTLIDFYKLKYFWLNCYWNIPYCIVSIIQWSALHTNLNTPLQATYKENNGWPLFLYLL